MAHGTHHAHSVHPSWPVYRMGTASWFWKPLPGHAMKCEHFTHLKQFSRTIVTLKFSWWDSSSRCMFPLSAISGCFRCPHCVHLVAKLNTQAVGEVCVETASVCYVDMTFIQAQFSGYHGCIHSKMTWLLLLIHMTPAAMPLWIWVQPIWFDCYTPPMSVRQA